MPAGSIRDFSNGVLNQNMLNKDSGAGIPYDAKNVITSFNGELKKRTGTKYLLSKDYKSVVFPFRDQVSYNDLLLVFSNLLLEVYSLNNGYLIPYISSIITRVIETWTSNTSPNGIILTQDMWNSSTSSTNLYKIFNNNYNWETSVAKLAEDVTKYGWQVSSASASIPTKNYAIVNFQFPTANNIAKFVFNFINIYSWTTSTDRRNVGAALLEPVIQFSDDGINWTSVTTWWGDLSGGSNNYTEIGLPGNGINNQNWSYNNRKMIIRNVSEQDNHVYWRVYFNNTTQVLSVVKDQNWKWVMGVNLYTQSFGIDGNSFVTTFSDTDIDNIKVAQEKGNMIITCEGQIPKQLVQTSGNLALSNFTPTGTTTIWTTNGYPSCVEFYAGRLWFAGFSAYPNRAMASAFNDFNNFTVPSTILTTSPIIADGRQLKSKIENMFGGDKALYLLSQDGVSMIDAPDGSVVSTSMIEMQLRNREPVASMTPTIKDDIMIYLGRDKRKILITDYDFVVQRFKAQNLSYNFDDFLSAGISELHYMPSKQSLIYGTLQNGDWFVHLFDANLAKNAIFPFDTQGAVYDITPIKYNDETKLIMVVQRNGLYYVEEKIVQPDQEKMDLMVDNTARETYTTESLMSDYVYLDCAIRVKPASPTSLITDLPYNIGDSVEVLADGVYIGTMTIIYDEISNSNALQFESEVSDVIVGYSYDSYWVLKFASPFMSLKSPKEISTYFINSGYLEVGNSFDDLKPVVGNLVDTVSINSDPVFMNGEYTITLPKQIRQTPYVIIRSDKGLPFTIIGLDYKVDLSNYQGGL